MTSSLPPPTAGIRQAVILASGLDTRAYRLPWPAGTVVYEIDQPQVIDFKTNTLADLGANPTAERRTVSIDLRDDWPAALREHGFDVNQPTAWSAEGLLPYLPPEAQDRLFDNITALSAPGSQLATEHISDPDAFSEESVQRIGERWQRAGFDLNPADLFYHGERSIVIDYLSGHGWQVAAASGPGAVPAQRIYLPGRRVDGDVPGHELRRRHPRIGRRMARTHDDSWDLASSVGATATMIAAGAGDGDEGSARADQRSVRRAAGPRRRAGLLREDDRRRARLIGDRKRIAGRARNAIINGICGAHQVL